MSNQWREVKAPSDEEFSYGYGPGAVNQLPAADPAEEPMRVIGKDEFTKLLMDEYGKGFSAGVHFGELGANEQRQSVSNHVQRALGMLEVGADCETVFRQLLRAVDLLNNRN